jgi:hypothetical protein
MDRIAVEDSELKLAHAAEALRKCDEHATAGRLAPEVMHDIRNPIEALRNLNYLTGLAADDRKRYEGSLDWLKSS